MNTAPRSPSGPTATCRTWPRSGSPRWSGSQAGGAGRRPLRRARRQGHGPGRHRRRRRGRRHPQGPSRAHRAPTPRSPRAGHRRRRGTPAVRARGRSTGCSSTPRARGSAPCAAAPTPAGASMPRRPSGWPPSQRGMVDAAVPLLRPGGMLVYSVCTLTDAETLAVDEHLATAHPGLRPSTRRASPGRPGPRRPPPPPGRRHRRHVPPPRPLTDLCPSATAHRC